MACDGNRNAYFAAVTGGGSAVAQAFGGTEAARQALGDLFDLARNGPKPQREVPLAQAQTRLMFTQMSRRGIKPPTHSTSGLPKADAQFGYALVQKTLGALDRGEPLPPQARDLLRVSGRTRQIENLRADVAGRVRCGSCGQFASAARGHVCPRTASPDALRRSLMRRLNVPPSAYPDAQLASLLEAARSGPLPMRHGGTGEEVTVTLDGLPLALASGFVPEMWAGDARRAVTANGTVLTVIEGRSMGSVPQYTDPVAAAAADFGLLPTPDMPIITDIPAMPVLLGASAVAQAVARAAELGFDDGAQLLLKNAVRLGKVAPEQVEDVLDLSIISAVMGAQRLDMGALATAIQLHDSPAYADLNRIAEGLPSTDQVQATAIIRMRESGLAPTIVRANTGVAVTPTEEQRILALAGCADQEAFTQLASVLQANWAERVALVNGMIDPDQVITRTGRAWDIRRPDGTIQRVGSRRAANEEYDRAWRGAFDTNGEQRRALLKRTQLLPNRWVDAAQAGESLPPTVAEPASPAVTSGAESFAYGSDPTRAYAVRYKVVDLDALIPSNLDSGTVNPAYDAALQPRQRDRLASQMQIQQVAQTLTPDALLTDFKQLDKGTPILGSEDNCVESGNGRVLALRKARESFPAQWEAYQNRLRDVAASFGIDQATVQSMRSPVLVRERMDTLDRAAFAREANAPPVLQMSTLENAVVDARRLSDETMLRLSVREDQSIDLALRARSNQGFVRDFMQTLPDNERATLMRGDGSLNQQGIWRIKAALFTRSFPGEAGRRLAETFTEGLDSTTKNFEQAVAGTLPQLVRAQSRLSSGQRSADLDLSGDIAASLDMLARLREQELPVPVYLEQSTLFERELTLTQETILRHFDGIGRSPKAIRSFLSAYAQAIEDAPDPGQGDMFGGGGLTRTQLLNRLINP